MGRVFTGVLTTKYWSIAVCHPQSVFSHSLVVFALESNAEFALLESFIHEVWSREYSGSLETRLRYSPRDCFETFPFPLNISMLNNIGESFYNHRQQIMLNRREGLTKTYNRLNESKEAEADIRVLRELHIEMDYTVLKAYGWDDLILNHGYYQTKEGQRFTIYEDARLKILERLLDLNHQRHAEEVAQGIHEKG